MLERDRIIEIVVAVLVVFTMIGAMVYIGSIDGDDSTLTPEGGEMLVLAIVGFIFLVTLVGVVLAYMMNDPPEADDGNSNA